MAYTVIVMGENETEGRPRSFRVVRPVFWAFVAWLVAFPCGVFYVTYFYLAPQFIVKDASRLAKEAGKVQSELVKTSQEKLSLAEEKENLEKQLQQVSEAQGDAQAKSKIAEQAHQAASERVKELELKVVELQQQLAGYQATGKVVPARTALMDCFDIKASSKDGKNLKYSVSFVRTGLEKKADAKELSVTMKLRLLQNGAALQAQKGIETNGPVFAQQPFMITRDRVVKGTGGGVIPKDGLRVVEFRAYDKAGRSVAQCWKAF